MIQIGFLLALFGAAATQCTDGYTQFGNNCFALKTQSLTWAQAEATCRDDGGHLASMHDNATDAWLINWGWSHGIRTAGWIGMRNQGSGPVWSDDSTVDFKNFAPAQDPPPICYAFSVVSFYYPGMWIPQSCDAILPFICQRSQGVIASTPDPFACSNGSYFGNNGTIYSPGYPDVFHFAECFWTISVFNNNANLEWPVIRALGYWEIEIYSGNSRSGQPLYTTTSFAPYNDTLRISSPTPQFYIVLQVEQNNDVNPFAITYTGTTEPLYPIPTPWSPTEFPKNSFAKTARLARAQRYF